MRHEKYLVSGKIPAVLSSQRSRFTSSFPPDERSTVNENFLPVASRGRSDIVLPENFEENEERISKTTQSVVSFGGEGVVSRCLKNQCQDQCSLSANAKWMVHLGVEKSRVRQNGSASVLSSVRSKRLRSATVATEDFEVRRVAATRRKSPERRRFARFAQSYRVSSPDRAQSKSHTSRWFEKVEARS